MKYHTHLLFAALCIASASAADTPPALSAQEIATRLSAMENGNFLIRARLEVKSAAAAKSTYQLQIKLRRTQAATDVVYQILWPKERNGESVLLHQPANGNATGAVFQLPDQLSTLSSAQMQQPLFGSDLSYEDVTTNVFGWDHQALIGEGIVDRVTCQILESRPNKGTRSSYASVRTWVDPRRLVALRIEKYNSAGTLVRRIDTTRVTTDDNGRHLPASIQVTRPGQNSTTEFEGSRIKRGIDFTAREFTKEGFKEVTTK